MGDVQMMFFLKEIIMLDGKIYHDMFPTTLVEVARCHDGRLHTDA